MKKQQRNRLIVAAVLTVLCALLALVPFTGLEAQGKGVLIVFVWAILMWIVRPIPEYLIGVLAAAILAIFFGMKTNVVSGFSSSGWWLCLWAGFIGSAVVRQAIRAGHEVVNLDVLTYAADRFKPAFMINLATLTGAIVVTLGAQMAGLFSNDDQLAGELVKAGEDTGERLWRMPMGPEYDKLIDSRFADMKNSGGRNAGSITAAQFLKRFVGETPWAHLDIAGTAMSSPETDINRAWASGYGVRLLDRLVRNRFEG